MWNQFDCPKECVALSACYHVQFFFFFFLLMSATMYNFFFFFFLLMSATMYNLVKLTAVLKMTVLSL
jgi:hypothetical protein